ncbi:MAG: 2,3,4,5-tetrahydropyridine-2,6-dicarboxylate N-succinyltransferase, partial [Pedococcus sp.]
MSSEHSAWGFGLATTTNDGVVLDTWYPQPALGARPATASVPEELRALVGADELRRVRRAVVGVEVDLDA